MRRDRTAQVSDYVSMIVGILIILGIFLVIGLGITGGKSGIMQELAKPRLKEFRGEVEYGCKVDESTERTLEVTSLKGISTITVTDDKYAAETDGETVTVAPKECDTVKICESGSGYGCPGDGTITVLDGGVAKVRVFHDFSGGKERIAIKDVS